ncbi:hypothetical protein K505DRAFT_272685 [Melanomma pulvis-pyrius CBS 109.77]|uniref:1-alkyl-2-acetylglycerophosphocholine esterase n=1 Tax=Melanomma pulvis-pyrius CBS 109.77 TaxID=1314802 RepID=A0A6A6XGV5_9PLEO|nr:hypothetical protein K505DRAFT_272685 [Melanomma pulvis-pyrius CBS 109.77]
MRTSQLALLCAISVVALQDDNRLMLPSPLGKYRVGKTQHIFNHITPHDPVAPLKWNGTGRFLLASIYYPTESPHEEGNTLQYLDRPLAEYLETRYRLESGILSKIWTPILWNAAPLPGPAGQNPLPTVLFGAGASNPCVENTMLSMDLASAGYPVVCIDHPGEAPHLQLPNGDNIPGIPFDETWDAAYKVYTNRIPDLTALLDFYPRLVAARAWPFNTSSYVSVGHSIGGDAAVAALAYERGLLGGVNLDGAMVGDNLTDVGNTFMFLGADGHTAESDGSWAGFLGRQSGDWQVLNVKGAKHSDYTDLTVLAELLGVGKAYLGLGPIEGSRMRCVTTEFVGAFLSYVLGGNSGALEGALPSREWPEVVSMRRVEDRRG